MPDITITIPSTKLDRVVNGICGHYGYQAEINGEPNPESKVQFAKRMLVSYVKDCVMTYEIREANTASSESITTDVETIDIT